MNSNNYKVWKCIKISSHSRLEKAALLMPGKSLNLPPMISFSAVKKTRNAASFLCALYQQFATLLQRVKCKCLGVFSCCEYFENSSFKTSNPITQLLPQQWCCYDVCPQQHTTSHKLLCCSRFVLMCKLWVLVWKQKVTKGSICGLVEPPTGFTVINLSAV